MNKSYLGNIGLALSSAILLVACGGGGGGSTSSAYVGTITGFGSVFVNGVEFDTSNTSISVDGSSGTENDLKVGMQVTIKGSASGSTGTASSITFNDDLEGLVISNSIASGQKTGDMNIMGQTVTVSGSTVFESKITGVTTPDQVTAGMILEVSGFSSGTGSVQATRIEVKAADLTTYLSAHAEGIEVKGIVSNLDTNNMTFDLGSMTVSYAGASLSGFTTSVKDGLYVEVKSTQGLDGITGNLVASKVELENNGKKGHDSDSDGEVEIKGLVTTAVSGNSFAINGEVITIDSNTTFKNIKQSGLLVDVMIEVEAYYINGALVAKKIELENISSNEIKGVVAKVTSTALNAGVVTMTDGTVIAVNSSTIMKDSRSLGVTPVAKFNLSFLAQGDTVEIKYYDDKGTLTATKLEREDP